MGQLHTSPGGLPLPSQSDPVSLKWIIDPSQPSLLQFSFSRFVLYPPITLCSSPGSRSTERWQQKNLPARPAVRIYLRTRWTNTTVYWQLVVLNSSQVNIAFGLTHRFWLMHYIFRGFRDFFCSWCSTIKVQITFLLDWVLTSYKAFKKVPSVRIGHLLKHFTKSQSHKTNNANCSR